jgi:hypothetical protein
MQKMHAAEPPIRRDEHGYTQKFLIFNNVVFLPLGRKARGKPLIYKRPDFARATGNLLERAPDRASGLSRAPFSTSLSTVFVDIIKNPLNTAT